MRRRALSGLKRPEGPCLGRADWDVGAMAGFYLATVPQVLNKKPERVAIRNGKRKDTQNQSYRHHWADLSKKSRKC